MQSYRALGLYTEYMNYATSATSELPILRTVYHLETSVRSAHSSRALPYPAAVTLYMNCLFMFGLYNVYPRVSLRLPLFVSLFPSVFLSPCQPLPASLFLCLFLCCSNNRPLCPTATVNWKQRTRQLDLNCRPSNKWPTSYHHPTTHPNKQMPSSIAKIKRKASYKFSQDKI